MLWTRNIFSFTYCLRSDQDGVKIRRSAHEERLGDCISAGKNRNHHVIDERHLAASELKDPIWHSSEWQIGSFSSEATICLMTDRPCRRRTWPSGYTQRSKTFGHLTIHLNLPASFGRPEASYLSIGDKLKPINTVKM